MNGHSTKHKEEDRRPFYKRAICSRSSPTPLMAVSPPRLLLVALLSSQILALTLIRFAPGRVEWLWAASSSPRSPRVRIFPSDANPRTPEHLPLEQSSLNEPEFFSTPAQEFDSQTNSSRLAKSSQHSKSQPSPVEQSAVTEESTEKQSTPKWEDPALISENLVQNGTERQSITGLQTPTLISKRATPALEISSKCELGRIFVYSLPSAFNDDLIVNCSFLNHWIKMCPFLDNDGMGPSLGHASPLGQEGSWYSTDQFTAEVVFHRRMLKHPCLTDKPELASAFYVPFYAGLDVGRYLWLESTQEQRDRLAKQLLNWLNGQHYWRRNGGWDHFLMVGRITWDFRRSNGPDWGSAFFNIPPMINTTRLLIERNPWDDNEMAVPYPTTFHPKSVEHLKSWQEHLRSLKRSTLFSFAGAPRNRFTNDFRAILLDQCKQAESCKSLDCSQSHCNSSQAALELFSDSTFCLQPRGDSFTRRSTFDCLIAGSIPVFFWHRSAYWQYKWHLPEDESSYSVFISKLDMKNGTIVEEVLKSFSPEKVQSMRETIIEAIPRLVYAVSGDSLKGRRDAFDIAVEGVLRRFRDMNMSSGK